MGRQSKGDIDVLIVDKSNSVTQIYHSTERRYIMKDSYHPGYVMLFKRSQTISSKGFKKYWKNIINRVEIHKRTGRGECFPATQEMLSFSFQRYGV
jgi:site-specific recombinase XerD